MKLKVGDIIVRAQHRWCGPIPVPQFFRVVEVSATGKSCFAVPVLNAEGEDDPKFTAPERIIPGRDNVYATEKEAWQYYDDYYQTRIEGMERQLDRLMTDYHRFQQTREEKFSGVDRTEN